MRKFKNLFEEPAADYKRKVDDEDEVKDIKPRSSGEQKFKDMHKVEKKGHPVAADAQHTGDRKGGKVGKSGQDHTGSEESGEQILKTYAQFMKMGGFGGDSYKGAGNSGGEKAPVMQGSSKIKEEVELDEAKYSYKAATFNGNVVKGTGKTKEAARKDAEDKAKALGSTIRKRLPEEVDLDEAFKAGTIRLKDGKTVKIDKMTAESLNNTMKQLNSTNRKRMETEAMKDKDSFDSMVKFAKAAV